MKRSLTYSIIAQTYIAFIGILLMPVYLHQMGAEAFGLIGLFIMAQAWIQILDMGFTPVLSRDIARMRAGSIAVNEALSRLRTLEWLFAGFVFGIIFVIASQQHLIAQHWISAHAMDAATIAHSLVFIAVAVSLRWFAGLYRGVLIGQERQNRVNVLLTSFATLRFVGVIPVIFYLSPSASAFFIFQAIVSAAELLVSRLVAMSELPSVMIKPNVTTLKSMLPMVGGMAFLNVVWILFTQLDKLILSGILSLQSYGYFTLAIVAASGILMLMPPLSQVVQPRFNFLVARGDEQALTVLYGLVSQYAVVGFVGVGVGLAFFAEPALSMWTGNAKVSQLSAPILFWYGLGNAAVGMMLAPFMLQFARGNLRLHIYIHAALIFFLIPLFYFAAHAEGGVGTGKVYFIVNMCFLLLWSPVVHHYFLPSLTWQWLFSDTLPIVVVMAALLHFWVVAMPNHLSVFFTLIWMTGAVLLTMLVGILVGAHTRGFILRQMGALK